MEMEMNLRFNKNHPDLVEARSSGIKKAYVTLWNFLIITYFCNHQEGENLLSAGLASETQRLRNKMRKWFQFSPPWLPRERGERNTLFLYCFVFLFHFSFFSPEMASCSYLLCLYQTWTNHHRPWNIIEIFMDQQFPSLKPAQPHYVLQGCLHRFIIKTSLLASSQHE